MLRPKFGKNFSLDIHIVNFSRIDFMKSKTMNKIGSTQDRAFMAVVGPSGCGKTESIFKMSRGKTY